MNFNIWAALVAAAVSLFGLGGLWYAKPVFGRIWSREAGVPYVEEGPHKGKHPGLVFAVSFAFAAIAAIAFAWILGPNPPLQKALQYGAIVGACFVATSFGINYQFGNRSWTLWLIDAGYHFLQFILYGLILGLWH